MSSDSQFVSWLRLEQNLAFKRWRKSVDNNESNVGIGLSPHFARYMAFTEVLFKLKTMGVDV